MKVLFTFLFVALSMGWTESRDIEFTNKCGYDIWINPLTNAQGAPLGEGIRKIGNGGRITYQIPNSGWCVQKSTIIPILFLLKFLLLFIGIGAVVSGPKLDAMAVDRDVRLDSL